MRVNNYHEKGYYKSLVKIGLPIAFAILIEFVAFNSVVIFMGRVAGIYAAAQNLLCTLITITFMIPFAISNAIAVKVGYSNGANNILDMKKYSYTGVGMSLVFMFCCAIIYMTFPAQIVSIYTKDLNLQNIVIPIMSLLAIYQIFDGLQISLSGICKGIKQTKIILIANFIAYWCISIPLGYYLAFFKNLKLTGFWIGLFTSSCILCTIMIVKLRKHVFLKREIS